VSGTRDSGDDADVVLVGERSTAWYSGAPVAPPLLVPSRPAAGGAVAGVRAGDGPGVDELATLFGSRVPDVAAVAALADELRRETAGDTVPWVHNRNINYTNVCAFKCRFCGFSKGPLSLKLWGAPYLLTLDDIVERRREAWERSAARSRCRPVSTFSAAR
jgi:FO synthase